MLPPQKTSNEFKLKKNEKEIEYRVAKLYQNKIYYSIYAGNPVKAWEKNLLSPLHPAELLPKAVKKIGGIPEEVGDNFLILLMALQIGTIGGRCWGEGDLELKKEEKKEIEKVLEKEKENLKKKNLEEKEINFLIKEKKYEEEKERKKKRSRKLEEEARELVKEPEMKKLVKEWTTWINQD